MLWTPTIIYYDDPFKKEKDLEKAILEVQKTLFGESRIFLDAKMKIRRHGRKQNIFYGYLLDLTSKKEPNTSYAKLTTATNLDDAF